MIAGFTPLASNFKFRDKLKSPAKINFFSKVKSKFSKREDRLFKTETVLALYKFIKRKTALLILILELIFDHHYQFFYYSHKKLCVPI